MPLPPHERSFTAGAVLAVAGLALAALPAVGVSPARAAAAAPVLTWGSVSDLPDGGFGNGSQVVMSSDGQVRAYTFGATDVTRQRVVFSTDGGSTYNDHDVTSGATTSEAGVLGMSDDGQTMAVVYRRWPGTYATLSTDGGSTWSAEQTLNDGASGRAWAPQVAVSGDGQTIVYAWYSQLSSKDTAQFTYSTDGGQSWSSTITPSTPGVAIEHDVNPVVSDDGQTIALGWKSDNTTTRGYFSFDGGGTWTAKDISAEGDGTTGSNMPNLGVSGDGSTLAYFWIAGTSVQTAVTSNAGSSWTNKVISSGRTQYGWPRVLLDDDGSHRLYGWADRPGSDWITRQSFTSDGGSNWTEDVALSVGANASGPRLAMSDDGTVMTSAWRERDTNSEFNIHAATTMNGGSSWESKQISDTASPSNAIYPYPAVSGDGTAMTYSWQFGPWGSHRIQTITAAIAYPATVPGVPALVSVSPGDSSVDLAWSAPSSDGGAAITSYTATASPGGATCTTSSTSCTITGLANGTSYTFTVKATNSAGTSAASSASAAVTPTAPAAAPAAPAPAAPAATPAPLCTQSIYQQGKRTIRWDKRKKAYKVTSRIRIFEDAQSLCRTKLTVIYRNADTKTAIPQKSGSTLGYRKLRGRNVNASVFSWPTRKEMRFTTGDSTGENRKNARLVMVSYLKKSKAVPKNLTNIELVIVRRIPRNPAAAASTANPLFAQKKSFRSAKGWATVR